MCFTGVHKGCRLLQQRNTAVCNLLAEQAIFTGEAMHLEDTRPAITLRCQRMQSSISASANTCKPCHNTVVLLTLAEGF